MSYLPCLNTREYEVQQSTKRWQSFGVITIWNVKEKEQSNAIRSKNARRRWNTNVSDRDKGLKEEKTIELTWRLDWPRRIRWAWDLLLEDGAAVNPYATPPTIRVRSSTEDLFISPVATSSPLFQTGKESPGPTPDWTPLLRIPSETPDIPMIVMRCRLPLRYKLGGLTGCHSAAPCNSVRCVCSRNCGGVTREWPIIYTWLAAWFGGSFWDFRRTFTCPLILLYWCFGNCGWG